jgi:hypothetical protein
MTTSITADGYADQPAFLSKERIIAKPGFNRWLVPPAALAIHLCIGMAYGFSVFWLPLSKALGITKLGGLRAGHELHRSSLFLAMRLADLDARLDLHPVLHLPGLLGSHLGRLA